MQISEHRKTPLILTKQRENLGKIKDHYVYIDILLLARSQYSEGPATGHLDTGFSWFPCVYISKCWDGSQDSKLPLHASHVALPT